jgi:hypothetical protein
MLEVDMYNLMALFEEYRKVDAPIRFILSVIYYL